MLDRVVPAGFEDVVETDDVALYIHIRILDTITHAGLGGEVDHDVEVVFIEKPINKFFISNASLEEVVVDVGWFEIIKFF